MFSERISRNRITKLNFNIWTPPFLKPDISPYDDLNGDWVKGSIGSVLIPIILSQTKEWDTALERLKSKWLLTRDSECHVTSYHVTYFEFRRNWFNSLSIFIFKSAFQCTYLSHWRCTWGHCSLWFLIKRKSNGSKSFDNFNASS